MRGKIIVGLAIVAVLIGGWYWGSPSWTLYQMKGAADAGDADSLSSYIDFPALRANLKEEFKAKAAAEMIKPGQDGMAALGAMFATTMVDSMVDAMITPATMRKVFIANKAKAGEGVTKVDATRPDMVVDHEGFDHFVLHEKGKPASEGGLVFTRHGLSWMLSGMRLPDEVQSRPAGDAASMTPAGRSETLEPAPQTEAFVSPRSSPDSSGTESQLPAAEPAPLIQTIRHQSTDLRNPLRRRWGGGYAPVSETADPDEVTAMNQEQLDAARKK